MSRKKVIISACLLGEYCRYDGKTKKVNEVLEAFKEYEIIPFCPEAPLFGTPREKISIVEIDGNEQVITDTTNKNVTSSLKNEIIKFMKLHANIDAIVLKSKSPSCGLGTTPVYNKKREILHFGNGLAASLLSEFYRDIKIQDENSTF